jgi:hypothetical protein
MKGIMFNIWSHRSRLEQFLIRRQITLAQLVTVQYSLLVTVVTLFTSTFRLTRVTKLTVLWSQEYLHPNTTIPVFMIPVTSVTVLVE